MGPESETTITPANMAMARTRFETSRDAFARAYAEGQNMLAFARNWITGRPDRAAEEARELRTNTLRLAEYMGRDSVVSGTVPGFRAEVASGTARAYSELQDDAVTASTEAVQTSGAWTGVSRFWASPYGDGLKMLTTGVLVAGHYFGWGYGDQRDMISHAAIAAGAIASMDVGRRLILETSTRYAEALPVRIAELIRRKASIDEGTITGDFNPALANQPGRAISDELANRTETALRNAFDANNIERPPLTRIDPAWTSGLRNVIESTLAPFDQTQELIRSREVAASSRLARTALALALAAGLTGHYFLTRGPVPEVTAGNCPVISFPDPNLHAEQSIGLNNVAHFSGIADEVFFFNAFDRSFNHSERDKQLLENLKNQDRFGNNRIVRQIARTLRDQNPQLQLVDTDTFRTRLPNGEETRMVGICSREQLQNTYRAVVETLDTERP